MEYMKYIPRADFSTLGEAMLKLAVASTYPAEYSMLDPAEVKTVPPCEILQFHISIKFTKFCNAL